eukprot:2556570-Alexandrium_andersonii.AAC.1
MGDGADDGGAVREAVAEDAPRVEVVGARAVEEPEAPLGERASETLLRSTRRTARPPPVVNAKTERAKARPPAVSWPKSAMEK